MRKTKEDLCPNTKRLLNNSDRYILIYVIKRGMKKQIKKITNT